MVRCCRPCPTGEDVVLQYIDRVGYTYRYLHLVHGNVVIMWCCKPCPTGEDVVLQILCYRRGCGAAVLSEKEA